MGSLKIRVNIVGTGPYLDKLIKLNDQLDTQVIFHAWLRDDSKEMRKTQENLDMRLSAPC